jgi:hypothetical protein
MARFCCLSVTLDFCGGKRGRGAKVPVWGQVAYIHTHMVQRGAEAVPRGVPGRQVEQVPPAWPHTTKCSSGEQHCTQHEGAH